MPRTTQRKGTTTVSQAGHKGGRRTAQTHGHDFYEKIGRKGGERVRKLINQGKTHEKEGRRR